MTELKNSSLSYSLGTVLLLLLSRLLSSLRSTPQCGPVCFTLSALLKRAFLFLIFYCLLLTLASLFLWLLFSEDSTDSFLTCFHLIVRNAAV